MTESKFIDYKGNPRTQFDRDADDTNGDMLSVVKYKGRVLAIRLGTYEMRLMTMDDLVRNLDGFSVWSVVNYDDERYTSVIIEQTEVAERRKEIKQ